jgi:hypothetical protein
LPLSEDGEVRWENPGTHPDLENFSARGYLKAGATRDPNRWPVIRMNVEELSLRPRPARKRRGRNETMRRSSLRWTASLLVSGCVASPPPFEVTLRLSPTPPLVGPTRLLVDVTDPAGDAVADASVFVEGLSDELPNGTATRGVAINEGAGRYVVPAFDLDVGGPWTVSVTVSDSTGVSITRAFPIYVYGGS